MKLKKAVVMQGGGPTRAINSTLAGIIQKARQKNLKLLGGFHGVEGLLNGRELRDISQVDEKTIELLKNSPGSALGSTRKKPTSEECREIVRKLREERIDYVFYIGGNDTALSLQTMQEYACELAYPIFFVHVPKTVDNDLPVNDHTPGFGSAARYISSLLRGVDLDTRSLKGIYLAVLMGRDSGFLTASSALARVENIENSGPDIICVPEVLFDQDKFLGKVSDIYSRNGKVMIAVSEGICIEEKGERKRLVEVVKSRFEETGDKDDFGHTQLGGNGIIATYLSALIKTKLGIQRVRGDTLGYGQRSSLEVFSDQDLIEAEAVGKKAVNCVLELNTSFSVVLNATRNPYEFSLEITDLSAVAGKVRVLPNSFLASNGFDVTSEFIDYAIPLIGSKPLPEVVSFV